MKEKIKKVLLIGGSHDGEFIPDTWNIPFIEMENDHFLEYEEPEESNACFSYRKQKEPEIELYEREFILGNTKKFLVFRHSELSTDDMVRKLIMGYMGDYIDD